MNRLRHPVRAIREPFGTAGLIVACVALIAALTGAAYAAGGLNAKQKKEVKKIAKQFAGKPGAPGATGPAGPAGAKGDTGAAGANGTNGKDGINGTNGKTGFTSTLPPGETETGAWGIAFSPSIVSLSFNIPLAEAPEALHYVNVAGEEQTAGGPFDPTPDHCVGTAESPTAQEGHVCVYAADEEFAGMPGYLISTFKTGATFFFNVAGGEGRAAGTWAVTAPEA